MRNRSISVQDGTSHEQRLSTASVHFGSYSKASDQHEYLSRNSARGTPSRNQSQVQLDHLLPNADADLETYGISELRDGFFDATYYRPQPRDRPEMMRKASETLPLALQAHHPLSLKYFIPRQWLEFREFVRKITTTRSGIRLFKSFLGFFTAYVISLIPASRHWLGRYHHIMALSTLLNHAGRPIGSQVDGAILTILGTIAGLAWGSLALYVSTSTSVAKTGYGGILATFLVTFTALVAWLRCSFIRLYQAVISAGISICYTCLADTSEAVGWKKLFDYGVPWVLGQAIALIVSCVLLPDSGSRSLTLSFHDALETVIRGLVFPRQGDLNLRRDLAWHFVRLSTAVRDFTIEISISLFEPDDIRSLRNLVQSVIRALLAIDPDTNLFDIHFDVGTPIESSFVPPQTAAPEPAIDTSAPDTMTIDAAHLEKKNPGAATDQRHLSAEDSKQVAGLQGILGLIARRLAHPTATLVQAMIACTTSCDAILIDLGCQHQSLHPTHTPQDLSLSLQALSTAIDSFEAADATLMSDPKLPSDASTHSEVVALFLFVHPLRQAADKVRALSEKVLEMQQRRRNWTLQLPSYPLHKQFNRTNAQVRHDRGGLTAGFYFRTKVQLERTMGDLQSRPFVPAGRHDDASALGSTSVRTSVAGDHAQGKSRDTSAKKLAKSEQKTLRYRVWEFLHGMQGFESRFALKVVLATTLLSVPAWLEQSQGWWNLYEVWWTVVTVWLMTHPRVSGTFQDLAARLFCVALGAVWGGLAYAAGGGNPYVMAVFAAIFMIPMMHRYTQSAHPRSGLIGCISFTVISLSALADEGQPSTITIAWTRGLALAVAIFASILTNWVMWPFVARHEMKKSISAMMLHLAILYRSVVSKYIYYAEEQAPSAQDIERSEMLEGRLREGFVRIRQLMELTRHEIHLVEVRQSSLYFQPSLRGNTREVNDSLTPYRRDAVAVILMNLHILASALRANQPVPRYMPSAAAARKKLVNRMEEVEVKQTQHSELNGREGRRWADVYRYAFASALTDIVEQLQQLQRYTKEITGEAGFGAVAVE
ncbi:MAG: hypothetical protein Q9166_000370 [cf. Caloplaca sp. 2 TL-2023]